MTEVSFKSDENIAREMFDRFLGDERIDIYFIFSGISVTTAIHLKVASVLTPSVPTVPV